MSSNISFYRSQIKKYTKLAETSLDKADNALQIAEINFQNIEYLSDRLEKAQAEKECELATRYSQLTEKKETLSKRIN